MTNHQRYPLNYVLMLSLVLYSCGPSEKQQLIENARKYKPEGKEKATIIQAVEEDNKDFNPEMNALKVYRPETSNRYHSDMVGMEVHPTRSTMGYAVDLLATEIPEYRERAFNVIETVIAAQDQDTSNDTYGIWPYHFEEPLEEMKKPDWNWADFIGVRLLEAYMKYHDVIPEDLKQQMEASLIHASRSIQKRDVKPGYTNIAIMGTLVTHLTGHLFDDKELIAYAGMAMKRFYEFTRQLKGFQEYNSPTYTRVALDELVRMKQYILDRETLEMVDYCYHTGWKVLATHFHPPTGQLAGPHSRSYSTLVRPRFYDWLFGASGGQIKFGEAAKPDDYYKLQHQIPSGLMSCFLETPQDRVQTDTFRLDENPPIGYTYLTPDYAFGSVNRSTTWQQRRPYLLYWGNAEDTKYMRIRLLHDFEDFGIGNIFTCQHKNTALTAMNFAIDGGDYHISLDRLENGKFKAGDVRLRFEMGGVQPDRIDHPNLRGFSVSGDKLNVHIHMLHSIFGDYPLRVEVNDKADMAWVDFVIYSGPEKGFNLTDLNQACFAWNTSVQKKGEARKAFRFQTEREGNRLTFSNGTLSVSLPSKPDTENKLQNGFQCNSSIIK